MFNPLENINPKSRLSHSQPLNLSCKLWLFKNSLGEMEITIIPNSEYERETLKAFMEMAVNLGFNFTFINTSNHTQYTLTAKGKFPLKLKR